MHSFINCYLAVECSNEYRWRVEEAKWGISSMADKKSGTITQQFFGSAPVVKPKHINECSIVVCTTNSNNKLSAHIFSPLHITQYLRILITDM